MLMPLVFAMIQSPMRVLVSDLDLSTVEQGWGNPMHDRSVEGHPLTIGGNGFAKGLGTHANSRFEILLYGTSKRFTATVGVDDEVGERGSVVFVVKLDGKERFRSRVLHGGESQDCDVDLSGARRMDLLVQEADHGIDYDHADWCEPVVTFSGKRPSAFKVKQEPPMPIAHIGSDKPEIHGPRIVGCSPNAPFLFRIPASGVRPIKFSAINLPPGVKLDSQQGILSGRVRSVGRWRLAVGVTSPLGRDKRDLTIVCGFHKLALTPPMGWNSWNVWGTSVDATKVRNAAGSFIRSGLANYGYQYVNIDDAWEGSRDSEGNIEPNAKFGDIGQLAAEVHSIGLKLGIYSSPGPKTCAGYEASYRHELSDAKTYARWGVDYLKYDWCSYGEIVKGSTLFDFQKPYLVMREALDQSGRDIVFSLCQYGMGDVYKWGKSVGGNLWRTTGDITDTWSSMSSIGFSHSERASGASPGGWNDPDMLVVGQLGWSSSIRPTHLTPNEQITHITLWSMLAAPLILGCDLTKLDAFTCDLITNPEVLDVDQDSLGKAATRAWKRGDLEVWTRPLYDGSTAVALFNRGSEAADFQLSWRQLGLARPGRVHDLWTRHDVIHQGMSLRKKVAGHGAALFSLIHSTRAARG